MNAPTITLASGPLVGTQTILPSATAAVNKFLGIPFALSPPERFAPPQSPKPWSSPLNVTEWKPACIQEFVYPAATRNFVMQYFNNPPLQESEDCLYLNVYAPATPAPDEGRTVMFWLFGGGLVSGNAGNPSYDGSSFAAYQDVIIVAPNYRTNVFGFPGSPEIPLVSRNVGFLDQRFALQWVQNNIAAFGGDPAKVTIFGESDGASSVDRLVMTLPVNPPFRAAIQQSGQASVFAGLPDNSTLSWLALVAGLDCSSASSALACVRSKPATLIKSVEEHLILYFEPAIDNVTNPSDPQQARSEHRIANVPLLTGTNSQEGRAYVVGQNNITAFIAANIPASTELQQAIAAAYALGQNGLNTVYDVIAQIYTEYFFQCPGAIQANASAAAGYPTWRYYFNASFPDTQLFPLGGVLHSSEIRIVFGTYSFPPYSTIAVTAQEYALSQYMQGAWAQFAKNPVLGPGWNRLGTFDGLDLGALGANGSSGVTLIPQAEVDARCELFKPIYDQISLNFTK
ncbi:MAG: hypothetical protein Q9195_005238 [Heterodermia aff. obscurata]